MKKRLQYINSLFYINVVLLIGIIFIFYYIQNQVPMFYVGGLFFVECLCICAGMYTKRKSIYDALNIRERAVIFILFGTQVMACLVSSMRFNHIIFDVHKIILYVGMVYVCYFQAKRNYISEQGFENFLKIIISLGVFACLYNLVKNAEYLSSFNLSIIMHYTWHFSSFFFTRATYGMYICICAIASLYKAEKNGSKLYLVLYLFFVANVLITAARMEMIAAIGASIIYLIHSPKYRKYVFGLFVVLLFILGTYGKAALEVRISNFVNRNVLYFMGHGGADISTGRIELWTKAMSYTDIYSFLFGHGLGSKDAIMEMDKISILGQQLRSFHSGYVDLFFETGIFGVAFILYIAASIIKNSKRFKLKRIQNFVWGIMSIWFLVNIADSNMLPFTTDMFSPFSTFIVFTLPTCMVNSSKSEFR